MPRDAIDFQDEAVVAAVRSPRPPRQRSRSEQNARAAYYAHWQARMDGAIRVAQQQGTMR